MSQVVMLHENNPVTELQKSIGDVIRDIEVFNTQVLVAVYTRPKKTAGGILMPQSALDEDKWQSKVGLILKKGPSAFVDDTDKWFFGVTMYEGDWIVFRPSDGWNVTINGILCRMLEDVSVKARIPHPDAVW